MLISETSFSQALLEFKNFLEHNKLPTEIVYVLCEDTFSRKSKHFETDFWIRFPLPSNNESLAERHYKIGQEKALGIGICAFAICESKTCYGLVIPRDSEDSEFLFMSTKYLKFSFIEDMPVAKPVRNYFHWKIFELMPFKYKKGNFFVYLESKKNLQFTSI